MNFLKNMVSTKDGEVSHKRVLGSIGFLMLTITMSIQSLWHLPTQPNPELIDAVKVLTMSAMFGTVIEKFSKNN